MVIIVGALEPQFRWSWGGVLGVGCVAIPLQLMATIGAYVQFGYMRLMQQKLTKIARKHSIRPNEDDLDK